jgi:hypothetical protein
LVGNGRIRARRRQSTQYFRSGENRHNKPDLGHLGLDPGSAPRAALPRPRAGSGALPMGDISAWFAEVCKDTIKCATTQRTRPGHRKACSATTTLATRGRTAEWRWRHTLYMSHWPARASRCCLAGSRERLGFTRRRKRAPPQSPAWLPGRGPGVRTERRHRRWRRFLQAP